MNSFNQDEIEDTKGSSESESEWGQTTQRQKKKDKQRSKNITHKPEDRLTQTPLKTKIHSKV